MYVKESEDCHDFSIRKIILLKASTMVRSSSAATRSRKRKRRVDEEQEQREARVARDLADPRWKRIRVRNPLVGKWWRGVVIGGARGETATRGLGESASLVLYEDGEDRVEDLNAGVLIRCRSGPPLSPRQAPHTRALAHPFIGE